MSEAQFRAAIHTRHAPTQLRLLTWCVAKVVNITTAVAGLFQKPTRGNLSLLEFELMALGYFLPIKEIIELDVEVERLLDKQKFVLKEMNQLGLIDRPDEHHPLVHDYVHTINESEELIQRVHLAYRRHVSFRNI